MASFESPLKAKKTKEAKPITKEESKKIITKMFKKPKDLMSSASVKAILADKMIDPVVVAWTISWIKNWVESESLPPQLLSNSFYPLLFRYFGAQKAEESLARIRSAYQATFPHSVLHTDKPESNTLIESDDLSEDSHPSTIGDPQVL